MSSFFVDGTLESRTHVAERLADSGTDATVYDLVGYPVAVAWDGVAIVLDGPRVQTVTLSSGARTLSW